MSCESNLRKSWIRGHELIHKAESHALEIAKNDINRRLDEMNELRKQITSERGEFLRREIYDREHASLREAMDLRIKALENTKANLEGRLWAIGAGISILVVGLELLLRYLGKG